MGNENSSNENNNNNNNDNNDNGNNNGSDNSDRRTRDDHSGSMNGMYNAGYSQGRRDAAEGSDDASFAYFPHTLPSGNKGYVDGYNDWKEAEKAERDREDYNDTQRQ